MTQRSNLARPRLGAHLSLCLLGALAFASPGLACPPIPWPSLLASQSGDLVDQIDRLLSPTHAQKPEIEAIVRRSREEISAIQADASLNARQRQAKIDESRAEMAQDLRPLLSTEQNRRLADYLSNLNRRKRLRLPVSAVSATYERYLPSSALARSVFGSSPAALGLGFGSFTIGGKRTRFDFGFDLFDLAISSSKLFVLSPQVSIEYRVPIARDFGAFGKLLAGPAYMDYSFDTPGGAHFGAKRLGADAGIEAGLRFGRVQLDAKYRVFTQPTPVDFDGLQLSVTVIVMRF